MVEWGTEPSSLLIATLIATLLCSQSLQMKDVMSYSWALARRPAVEHQLFETSEMTSWSGCLFNIHTR